jgi:opacity protein-like surface antigen
MNKSMMCILGFRRLAIVSLLLAVVSVLPCTKLAAQQADAKVSTATTTSDEPRWATSSHWNFGLGVGYGAENNIPNNISHINLLIFQPQLGIKVKDFQSGPLRRFELVNEGVLGGSPHPGGYLLGTTLFLRFDFKPIGNVMPFFDAGSSFLRTSLADHAPEVSGTTNFMPQGGLGIQYYFRPRRAFVVEYRYFHMSNAGVTPPNHGFNGSEISVGFRWLKR